MGPSNAARQQLPVKLGFSQDAEAFPPSTVPAGWVDIRPQPLAEQEMVGDTAARRSKRDREGGIAGGQDISIFSLSVACWPRTFSPLLMARRPEGSFPRAELVLCAVPFILARWCCGANPYRWVAGNAVCVGVACAKHPIRDP